MGRRASELDVVPEDERQADAHNEIVRTTSALSSFPGEDRGSLAPQNVNAETDSLGLQLITNPPEPAGDIIFVHGLGGGARKTWSWNRDIKNFWPVWLQQEEGLSTFRVFSFGYNSNWKGSATNLNISDFAKELLLHMLSFDGSPIGISRIVFVAHSMGGLVVKKAFLLGKQDPQYSSIMSNVHGLIFLATPHRGAHHATTLNNILSSTPLGPPPKLYVADLQLQSHALQEVNEQFRHHCEGLLLVSFFETLKVSFGVSKAMIVEKDSAVLSYPGEISSPLHADHHTICKFRDKTDPNYIIVRNILKLCSTTFPKSHLVLMSNKDHESLAAKSQGAVSNDLNTQIRDILGIREDAIDDFKPIKNRIMTGSYTWFPLIPEFHNWVTPRSPSSTSSVFWLFGMPAAGKSSIASIVIDHLETFPNSCQYHFFTAGHQTKRTAAYCLRSIATQLAQVHHGFRDRLFELKEETGITFNSQSQNFHTIWEQIFEGIVFKMNFDSPLFWVFDAIDESDSQNLFLNHMTHFHSVTPVNIFLTSRPVKLPSSIVSYRSTVTHFFLTEAHTKQDVQHYIANRIREALPDDENVQQDLIDQLLTKACGSFLWVRLALESLQDNWHTSDDIHRILTEIPSGMIPLYERMLESIATQSDRTQELAHCILTWVSCSWRPLKVDELEFALKPKFKSFTKFEDTVNQVCGHFVSVVDGQVKLIHVTARQFLTENRNDRPAYIHGRQAHQTIALACLEHLSHDHWRRIFQPFSTDQSRVGTGKRENRLLLVEKSHPLLGYATCYWAYHVSRSPASSPEIVSALRHFFNNHLLSWIEAIALSSNMKYVIRSAKYLRVYAKLMRSRVASSETLASLKHIDDEDRQWLQAWATDCIRLVGKFGSSLMLSPSSIHRVIPPFCPKGSNIGRIYGEPRPGLLSVSGLSSDSWDDCLASVSVGEDVVVSKVLATDSYFITLINSRCEIAIWDADTCQKARSIDVKEYTFAMALNKSRTLLVTSSDAAHCVWELSTGKLLHRTSKSTKASTKFVTFQENEIILVGSDDCTVTAYNVSKQTQLFRKTFIAPQDHHGCPAIMEISTNLKKVGLAWRGKPPIVWDIDAPPHQSIQRCRVRSSNDSLVAPEALLWHPDGSSLFILCQDTNLVDWNIYDERQTTHIHLQARQVSLSHDGNLLLSCNTPGTISVWSFPQLTLVYQLICDNDFVRDIGFSPDGQRIYDARGSICNVWEPDALIRPEDDDLEDHSSLDDRSFATTEPVVSYFDSEQSPVTALATSSGDEYYCCGREDGTVIIHDMADGKRLRKVYSHSNTSAVLLLAWSTSGRFMVSSDDSARIIVKRLEVKASGKWAVFPLLDTHLKESAQQFLFSQNEQLLLVSGQSIDHVYDLKTKRLIHEQVYTHRQNRFWTLHQFDESLLMWISPETLRTYTWTTLQEQSSMSLCSVNQNIATERAPEQDTIIWVAYMKEKNIIAYATIPNADQQTNASTLSHSGLCLETIDLSMSPELGANVVRSCNRELATHVKQLIGTYEGRIIYLDHEYWLCSWDLNIGERGLKRHFVLPKDWLNVSSFKIALLNDYGTFLCPKHGRVAAVRNGIFP